MKALALLAAAVIFSGCMTTYNTNPTMHNLTLATKPYKPTPDLPLIRKYDEFKDITTIETQPVHVRMQGDYTENLPEYLYPKACVTVLAAHPGVEFGGTMLTVRIDIVYGGFDWHFLESRDLTFLADGERIRLGEMSHGGDVSDGAVYEFMGIFVKPDTLARLAGSRVLRCQVGELHFDADEPLLLQLRRISQEVERLNTRIDGNRPDNHGL